MGYKTHYSDTGGSGEVGVSDLAYIGVSPNETCVVSFFVGSEPLPARLLPTSRFEHKSATYAISACPAVPVSIANLH